MAEVFQTLFYEHYSTVVRKLIHLVRDESVAEDLAQEVFLRLYRNPPNEMGAVGAWLHRVATRIGYDYLNQQTRERNLLNKQGMLEGSNVSMGLTNEDITLKKMDQEEVQRMLSELPERDRQLLLLKYSGYSYAEIAEQLQVNTPRVGTLLHRAVEKFRKQTEKGLHF